MDRVIINGRYFTVVEFVRTHVVSVKRGYTNLTEYRANANVSIEGDGATTTQLGGDPILDEFEISQEDLEVKLWRRRFRLYFPANSIKTL